ncbi:hypothetical protein [Stenotrophomonas acidaminiphila]|uniref:hypothetical protein n=1 Tax=Stenotrophomonas acidaminiphila TaxID=128780 RepID=UPI0028B00882|nr:hypothetical protein [Stenotrophomonas acidaminiphila]
MQGAQQPDGATPPRRPRTATPSAPRNGGGLTLTRLALAAVALLVLAWFIGKRPAAGDAPVTRADPPAPAPAAAPAPQARLIRGEKSTTLADIGEARMTLQDQGTALRVEGGVGRNFASGLGALLDAAPSVRRIDITSGGGYAVTGLEAARIVRRNNLTVRVRGYCASICVALWAAAAQRQMEPDAVIGLHQRNAQCDALPSPDREECHYQDQFATEHDSSYRAWLQAAGFNQRLLDLQARTASEDIAVLTAPLLWDNGVDFSVVDRDGTRLGRADVERLLHAAAARH